METRFHNVIKLLNYVTSFPYPIPKFDLKISALLSKILHESPLNTELAHATSFIA